MKIYKQTKDFYKVPKGAFFTIKKDGDKYKISWWSVQNTSPFEILNKSAKPKETITLTRKEVCENLTMYGYRIYHEEDEYTKNKKGNRPILAMSKLDVMEQVECIKENMSATDELYIYRVYGATEQGQTAVKKFTKQGNRLVLGEL